MFNWFRREPEKPNYAKIVGITLAIIAAIGAVTVVAYKLFNKYFKLVDGECEDFLDDECEDCDICIEDDSDCECNAVVEDNE